MSRTHYFPVYRKNTSFFGENVHYKNVHHIFPPDDTTKILQFKVKCPVLRCSEQLPDYITELHRFLGKCPRVFCSQHLLQIIPINYLISCKNVHDFVVRTISSDYIWNIAHFWEKCKHQRCHYNFLPIIH